MALMDPLADILTEYLLITLSQVGFIPNKRLLTLQSFEIM